jgi:hypothetical protein
MHSGRATSTTTLGHPENSDKTVHAARAQALRGGVERRLPGGRNMTPESEPCVVYAEHHWRIARVDRLFEGEEAWIICPGPGIRTQSCGRSIRSSGRFSMKRPSSSECSPLRCSQISLARPSALPRGAIARRRDDVARHDTVQADVGARLELSPIGRTFDNADGTVQRRLEGPQGPHEPIDIVGVVVGVQGDPEPARSTAADDPGLGSETLSGHARIVIGVP